MDERDDAASTAPPASPPQFPLNELEGVAERRERINTASLAIIATILSIVTFTFLGPVLQPVLIAIFLFFMIKPAADWLVRRGLREWIAWITLFSILVIAGILLTQVVYDQGRQFREHIDEYRDDLLKLASDWSGRPVSELEEIALTDLLDVKQVIDYAVHFTVGFVELALMVFFYLMFVILDASDFPGRVRRAFSAETADHLMHVGDSIVQGITDYMRVKTLVSLGMGATAGFILWLFSVPYWELWAFLTFLLNYVTYIGSLLTLVPPIAVAFAVPSVSSGAASVITVLLSLNRVVWIDYVEIHHSGRQLNINSVLILMSLAYWGWFWGILGLILAVPMLTCAKIVLSNFESTKRWAILMTED